ncbi:hypothetical protein NL507_30790, partial [Klebsiella pneumoniae]|nr:hypothetical protein [Klebsiella pneumoniae]
YLRTSNTPTGLGIAFEKAVKRNPKGTDVLIASANAYVYAIDTISGIPRFQRRVAVSEGRSDIQRLIDIDGDPVVAGQLMVTTSF